MKETFSPYSARFITLKTCILPPLLTYTSVISSKIPDMSLQDVVSPIAQGVLVCCIEILTIWGTKALNERTRKKKLFDINSQVSDLEALKQEGIDPAAVKDADKHIKQLNAEKVKLTATRF